MRFGSSTFPDLPLEIQGKIWDAAIPDAPGLTAYRARLVRQAQHRAEDGSFDETNTKDRVHLHYVSSGRAPSDGERTFAMRGLAGLMGACTGSVRSALLGYERLRPGRVFPLRRSNSSRVVEMDAAADLVILQPGWQWPCSLIGNRSVTRLEQPPRLDFLGLAWPGPRAGGLGGDGQNAFYYFSALNGLLALWGGGLRALFVVVDPDRLREAAELPWAPASDRRWDAGPDGRPLTLEAYLEAYGSDDLRGGALTFRGEGREYFEVSHEQVARSGGLGEVVELLESARRLTLPSGNDRLQVGEGDEEARPAPPRCRVMTWRQL